jgi:imidazolonepropionase-like amidohydrolase
MLLLLHARLFDGTSPTLRNPGWLLVEGERIAAVGRSGQPPPSVPQARVLRLDGQTLLPGLINRYIHFNLDGSGDTWGRLATESDRLLGLRAVKVAEWMLRRGITSVRDLAAEGPGIIAPRQAIKAG